MRTAKEIYLYVFGALFVVGFFYLAVVLKDAPINATNSGTIETIKNCVILIVGFFFGSSKGSQDKNEKLNK